MNTKEYRKFFSKQKQDSDKLRDLDFLGCYYQKNNKIIKKGFFHLYHGDKESEIDFLRSQVEIAEDGQAVYEFLQNAVDASSSEFHIYYDAKYFLVINNGNKFQKNEISSLLNFSQSTKSNNSQDKIGKFGIGFKLIHRLVGKNNGLDEIINDYKGPILFSWDKNYLSNLLNNDLNKIDEQWLFKILYTNFPCGVDEKIKDKNYQIRKPFSRDELQSMINFIKRKNVNLNNLTEGSIFFLELGKGKKELLDEEYNNLKKGIEYSLNIIQSFTENREKKLNNLVINDLQITNKKMNIVKNKEYMFLTPTNEEVMNFLKDRNEKISFFKYFPMGDQKNGLNFIVHSQNFDIESNRRKLHNTDINKKLLQEIANDLIKQLENKKINEPQVYTNILKNLYLSDLEKANDDILISQNLTGKLLKYIQANIPFLENQKLDTTNNSSNIIVMDSRLNNIPLQKFHHFYFKLQKDEIVYSIVVNEAIKKLNIKKKNIVDVFIEDNINSWVMSLSDKNFNILLEEIQNHKRKKSQEIVELWKNDSYTLVEIKRILMIFEILNNKEITFAIVKNKEKYEIKTNAYHDYIENKEFKEFLEKTYDLTQMNYDLIPDELEDEILTIIKKKDKTNFIIEELLNAEQHKELITFIKIDELKKYFLETLDKLELNSEGKYQENSFELQVLDMMLDDSDNIKYHKEKIFIDRKSISKLSKSPYITFKYGRVISPKSYENKQEDKNVLKLIDSLEEKYQPFFELEEDDKEEIYQFIKNEIKSSYHLDNKINTFNRLLYIILYSLEENENFILSFDGLKDEFSRKYGNSENSFQVLHNVFKTVSLTIDEIAKKEIFEIEDFFPNRLDNDYYILDEKLALTKERLPSFFNSNKNILKDFKKLGLKIDTKISKIRKTILDAIEINSDDLNTLTKEQYKNTISFLGINQFEFKLKSIDYSNIEKLFKKMDTNIKLDLESSPCLEELSTLRFKEQPLNSSSLYFIGKEEIDNENSYFINRLEKEISEKNIIYMDILNIDDIPKNWILIQESEEEKTKNKQKFLDKQEESIKMESQKNSKDDFEHRWYIGWKGERFVYEKLIQKFSIDNVVWHNENSKSSKDDKGGIDIEIKDESGNIIHNIEVKTTVTSSNFDKTLAFYMSSGQFQQAQQFGNDTHLIFVTGIDDSTPKMLVMNFDNSWID